jgi:hypothetical protein
LFCIDNLQGIVYSLIFLPSEFVVVIASSPDVPIKKFAHRYARGNALYGFRFEFTYQQDWIVLMP